jgi:hypothetical protein
MKNLHENFVNNKFESIEDEQLSETIGGEWLMKYPLGAIINFAGTVFNSATGN